MWSRRSQTRARPTELEGAVIVPDLGPVRLKLAEAQRLGFLGPGSVDDQLEHSSAFVAVILRLALSPGMPAERSSELWRRAATAVGADLDRGGRESLRVADLGSGGGLPGLVLASLLPAARVYLIEGSTRRAHWLARATAELELRNVEVVGARAELVGRSEELRGTMHVVTSRSFGPTAVVAECAAPLLSPGGVLVVSEPPRSEPLSSLRRKRALTPSEPRMHLEDRWPSMELRSLGLSGAEPLEEAGRSFTVLTLRAACPERFPRRTGVPEKRPLF
jgi:16S rRNA (guanine527-N7)-methyltransferase